MLTLDEIKNKKFEKSAFGYKQDDVESFLDEVIELIENLESENEEQNNKLMVLAGKIEEYRSEEDSLRQALLGAQKLGDNILKEAKNRAEIIMRDANIKSENAIKNIQNEVKREEVILNKMKREVDGFKTKMLTMYNSHIELINSIPEIERKASEAEIKEEIEEKTVVNEPEVQENKAEVKEANEVKEVNSEEPVIIFKPEEKPEIKQEPEQNKNTDNDNGGFKIGAGFKFSKFDEDDDKKESKFGPLKFGEGYDINDDKSKR